MKANIPKDWQLHETPRCRTIYATDAYGKHVCIATIYCSAGHGVERHARIMVAAPDLLDLAREWVDLWDGGYSPQLLRDHTDKCRAVLARVGRRPS